MPLGLERKAPKHSLATQVVVQKADGARVIVKSSVVEGAAVSLLIDGLVQQSQQSSWG